MPADLQIVNEIFHLCYTRSTWAAPWTERPLLECLQLTDALAPSHGSAQFLHVYGTGMMPQIGSRPADNIPTAIAKPDYLDHYVKVVLSTGVTWHGIIVEQDDQQLGVLDGNPSGRISYTAMALTFLLERAEPIRKSRVLKETVVPGDPIQRVTVNIGIPFNGGSDGRDDRTRVTAANYDSDAKCFTDRTLTTEPKRWKAKDAFEYLLAQFPLKNASGTELFQMTISTESKACLDYELPELQYHGMTLWQLLTRLVDRRRGLMLYAKVTGTDQLSLVVDSSAKTQITLPSTSVIPANRNQRSYQFDTAVNVGRVSIGKSALQKYDQVEVIGERVGVVFTVSPELGSTGQMDFDWEDALEEEYEDAATGETGYSALTDEQKAAANADFRAADKFAPVYSWWRLRWLWDGKGKNKISGGTNKPAVITVKDNGDLDITTVAPFWLDGLRFADFVPMRPAVDYRTDVKTEKDEQEDERQQDYLAPMVFVKLASVNSESGSTDAGWVHAERINAAIKSGAEEREYEWAIQLKARRDAPGFIFEVVGAPQHYAASDSFTAAGTFEEIPSAQGVTSRNWLATVYMPLQQHVRGVYPKPDDVESGDLKRVLQIQLPSCHLDYLIEGSVVAVKGGALQTTEGGHLRDDRKRADDLAKLAYQWYGETRQTLNMSFRGIAEGFSVGQLVTSVKQDGITQDVNTVISAITLDLKGVGSTIATNFSELDLVGVTT